MKDSIRLKLESVQERFEEIAGLLADPDVIGDQNQFRELSKEYARVGPVVQSFEKYQAILGDIAAAKEMIADADEETRAMGAEELAGLSNREERLLAELQRSLIPRTRLTRAMFFWRYAPAPVAMKLRFLPATCFACIPNSRSPWAGRSKSCQRVRESMVATRKSSAALPAAAFTPN